MDEWICSFSSSYEKSSSFILPLKDIVKEGVVVNLNNLRNQLV